MSEEKASMVLTCSKEAFRIYDVLCKSEETEGKRTKKGRENIFSSRTPAFFLAVAIGLLRGKQGFKEKEKQLTRRDYIINHPNFAPFEQLIKIKYNLKSQKDVVDEMLKFQEMGIRELYDEYHKTGRIDFLRLYRDAKSGL